MKSVNSSANSCQNSNPLDMTRYSRNFMLFSNLEIETEKKLRDDQLTKIVEHLLRLEKKLRKEQDKIRQQLVEKDKVINSLTLKLKSGAQSNDQTDANLNDSSEMCPMCRSYRSTKFESPQTSLDKQKRDSTNISDDYSSVQSIEYMSSSEEQDALSRPNPFTTARRSKKYTSKKSYKDYQEFGFNNSLNKSNGGVKAEVPSNSDNNNNINIDSRGLYNANSKSVTPGTTFSTIMNDIHGISEDRQKNSEDPHSLKINRMHGISVEAEKAASEALKTAATKENSKFSKENSNNQAITRKYCDGLEVKQQIAPRDDWYISDLEETETFGGKRSNGICRQGVSNSVLECVNQILLQQSDDFIEAQKNGALKETKQMVAKLPKPSTTPARVRRVHFSTKNSMVQIAPVPSSPRIIREEKQCANDYEPIGLSRVNVKKVEKVADNYKPALPPKPDNLMKLKSITSQKNSFKSPEVVKKSVDYDYGSDSPDYCSIAEINETINMRVVTAEIHNYSDGNEYSESLYKDNSFEDVPKLPNVYSIIPGIPKYEHPSPKLPQTFNEIDHDNYITKSIVSTDSGSFRKKPQRIVVPIEPQQAPQKIQIEEFQHEFDCYNLDDFVEEGNASSPAPNEKMDELVQLYDLDLEFESIETKPTFAQSSLYQV